MKKQLLFALALAASICTFAQTPARFSVRAGLASANMQGDAARSLNDLLDYSNGMLERRSHTGIFAGASASLSVAPSFFIEPGLQYTQRGTELRGELAVKGLEFIGAQAKARLTTHYIDVPVLLKADFNGLQVFAGPQLSYLASASLRTTAGALGFNVLNKRFDATEQFNRWDASLTGGLGYQFANGLQIHATYDHGLMRTDADRNLHAFNRSVKLGVGFRL